MRLSIVAGDLLFIVNFIILCFPFDFVFIVLTRL